MTTEQIKRELERLGVWYNGPQRDHNGLVRFHLFTDRITKSSFAVTRAAEVSDRLQRTRDLFGAGVQR